MTSAPTIEFWPSQPGHHSGFAALRTHFVTGLVQLHLHLARHLEMGNQSVAVIGDWMQELYTTLLERFHGLLDIVAVKRNVMCARRRTLARVGRMATHFGFRQFEYQPSAADVGGAQAQLFAQEGAESSGTRGIEHSVNAFNHTNWLSEFLCCRVLSQWNGIKTHEAKVVLSLWKGRLLMV